MSRRSWPRARRSQAHPGKSRVKLLILGPLPNPAGQRRRQAGGECPNTVRGRSSVAGGSGLFASANNLRRSAGSRRSDPGVARQVIPGDAGSRRSGHPWIRPPHPDTQRPRRACPGSSVEIDTNQGHASRVKGGRPIAAIRPSAHRPARSGLSVSHCASSFLPRKLDTSPRSSEASLRSARRDEALRIRGLRAGGRISSSSRREGAGQHSAERDSLGSVVVRARLILHEAVCEEHHTPVQSRSG
jgi:hypothetical protein